MSNKKNAEERARELVNGMTLLNGGIALVPSSTIALTLLEGWMVRKIGRYFSVDADRQDVAAVVGAGSGAVVGHTAGEAAKLAGAIFLHPPIAAGIAKGIGEVAINYFRSRSPLPDA